MNTPNSHDIKVLNGLAVSATDSADGYAEAAASTEDDRHRGFLLQRSQERRQIAADLQAAVRGLGGQPDDDSSILAKAQRAFTDIKHALVRDEATALHSAERGEEHLQSRFEHALADDALSATTKETIRRAHASVRIGQEQMHDLRRSLEGQHDADNPLFPQ